MAAKNKNKSIKDRKERISARKKKSVSGMIDDSMKPSRSFKEAAGIVGTIAGPGKFTKGFKTIKQAANAVRIKKAKRRAEILQKKKNAGKDRIKRSEQGIRATNKSIGSKLSPKQEAAKKALGDQFTPEAIAKRTAAAKRARETKAAAQKLTRKRKAQQKRMDKK